MKNKKIRCLSLGILASLVVSSTPVFATTNVTTNSNYKSVQANILSNKSDVATAFAGGVIQHGFLRSGAFYVLIGNTVYLTYTSSEMVGYGHLTSGASVTCLQAVLNNLGYNVSVDGIFGDQTQGAVLNFQNTHSLSSDGIVGPNTWNTMLSVAGWGK